MKKLLVFILFASAFNFHVSRAAEDGFEVIGQDEICSLDALPSEGLSQRCVRKVQQLKENFVQGVETISGAMQRFKDASNLAVDDATIAIIMSFVNFMSKYVTPYIIDSEARRKLQRAIQSIRSLAAFPSMIRLIARDLRSGPRH